MATEKQKLGRVARRAVSGDSGAASVLQPEVLKEIVRILSEGGLTTLDWRRGDERLILHRGEAASSSASRGGHHAPPVHATVSSVEHAPSVSPAPVVAAKVERSGTVVTSPFVGTFYRSPSPDAPSFVEEGQTVRKGQVLCIVEAMKLMNEIEAEVAGKVTEVIGQNGQTVEFGQALFRIEPS
jgi:acetyl-CoA carboxylase biotin carboxyl carrier protein